METPEVINEGKPQGLTKKDYLKNPEKARYRENEREGERERNLFRPNPHIGLSMTSCIFLSYKMYIQCKYTVNPVYTAVT